MGNERGSQSQIAGQGPLPPLEPPLVMRSMKVSSPLNSTGFQRTQRHRAFDKVEMG